jgi:hypothetical protein
VSSIEVNVANGDRKFSIEVYTENRHYIRNYSLNKDNRPSYGLKYTLKMETAGLELKSALKMKAVCQGLHSTLTMARVIQDFSVT